ncbi:AAWKG family protein, partial [Streptomyces galbus]|uniref:AAWKG family protein n=1 Tax=Streptomyces galbus TaxID=33898 RepID=UPI003819A817
MVAPAHSTDDYWHQAITLLTGYPAPERKDVFNKLVGNDNIPLMEVEITDSNVSSEDSLYEVTNNLYWRASNSGSSIEEKNIIVPFYAPMDGSQDPAPGTRVKLRQAKIRLLGSRATSSPPMGGVDDTPGDFGTYDDLPLKQYSYGGGMALRRLLDEQTTAGFEWNGLQVPLSSAVDTRTFERAAAALSRAAAFFENQSKVLDSWENRLGPENPVWRGQAAGVFRDLVHKLNKMYGNYQEDIPRVSAAGSKQGQQLMEAHRVFVNSMLKLHHKWDWWQIWRGNPLRWLHDNLLDLTKQIWEHNITQVKWEKQQGQSYTAPGTMVQSDHRAGVTILVTEAGFRMSHDLYGRYDDLGSWKLIGEQGIREWQNSVITDLGVPARDAIMDIRRAFGTSLKRVKTRPEKSLSEDLMTDTNKKTQDEQKKAQEEAQKKQDEYLKEQEKKQDEAQKKSDEYLKEQQRKEDERTKKEEEAQKKLDERNAAAEKKQQELNAAAQAKSDAYLKAQEERQAEQDRQAKEQRAQEEVRQQQILAQQKADAAELQKQQDERQAEQERKQAAQEAKAQQLLDEQEQKRTAQQAEQEARQQQLLQDQEQTRAQQQAEQKAEEQRFTALQTAALVSAKGVEEKERQRQAQLEAEQKEQEAKQQQLLD